MGDEMQFTITMRPNVKANFPTRCARYGQMHGLKCAFSYEAEGEFETSMYYDDVIDYDCIEVEEEFKCEDLNIWNRQIGSEEDGYDFYAEEANRGCDKIP